MTANKNLNRVMESDTILKNGASPKSQMSRSKQLMSVRSGRRIL